MSAPHLPGSRLREEQQIELSGDINKLQRHRLALWAKQNDQQTFHYENLLQTEIRLLEITQRQEALEEQLAKQYNGQSLKKEIAWLSQESWLHKRKWWCIKSSFQDGPLMRGIQLWRSHPNWYMHRVLYEDCVGRGGCCERGCNCCVNRQFSKEGRFATGHCTVECSCCAKARGFELSTQQKDNLRGIFSLSHCSGYTKRMWYASLLGLMTDSIESPFDMIIDTPPRYETPPVARRDVIVASHSH
ncbi:hypothetical protein N7495_002428 [Penicillium taxi]|uniref:uncharacterized protein n=1 Tax=Penicillium taxi TaxID=168475 RepID=UPI0025450269|nr:uncharacterized protein N7495_002428 [Penicillium taxi]KAJ5901900.1 hypothetical protein N7495_002428 [Penicillium taxi]